jgi:3-phosphoshikimate 1-carboxyvinyltransferase
MSDALQSSSKKINIGHAGTAMRFLTSFFSVKKNSIVEIYGSKRMHKRPISILVKSLKEIGAEIEYLENGGFPPLKITGHKLQSKKLKIDSSVSSQFISSLILIAPKIEGGLEIEMTGKDTSLPYIEMTIDILKKIGVSATFQKNIISISQKDKINSIEMTVEPDWSSASYFYSIVSLAEIGYSLELSNFKSYSIQGDKRVSKIFELFGVKTTFLDESIRLEKIAESEKIINLDLSANPDLAQTIAVTCLALNISCKLIGLHTLKIKETDRITALENEIKKFNVFPMVTNDSIEFNASKAIFKATKIRTYEDHRMAMAFACLAVKTNLEIENPGVVCKSYPEFWDHLASIGIN